MRAVRSMTVTALAAGSVAVSVALPSPASAADSLTLSLTDSYGHGDTVSLTCEPTGGTHPDAEAACTALAAVNGQISRIPPESGVVCTADYDPTTATASGYWRGLVIDYRQTFTNPCFANVETGGHVFHFWKSTR